MIQVSNVSKSFEIPHERRMTLKEHMLAFLTGKKSGFEPLHALRDVSFEVHKGEFFSVIGKNGSGKSTLLKIMAGIYAPDSGGVRLEGTVSPFLELGVGFNPNLSARENVFLSGAVMGLRRREIEALYDDIISFSELEMFQDQALKNFSSGMRVRLAFSVAFKVDADILLIDEVLAVGDASFRQKCYDVFGKLVSEGKTLVFVSHSMGDVKSFSDRVMLLHEGKVVSIGEPEKVIHDYQLLTAYEDEKRMAMEVQLKRRKEAERAFVPQADEHRWGSGEARIRGIAFIGAAGREKHVFASGEEVCMRISCEVRESSVEALRASVSIRRSDGVRVFETTSGAFGRPARGEAEVELVFPRLCLLAATYYFDAGLLPPAAGREPYDFIKGSAEIRVYQESKSPYAGARGVSYLDHRWVGPARGDG